MDARLRDLERRTAQGDPDAGHQALLLHRRIGTPARLIPPHVLYAGSETEGLIQPVIDFRNLLTQPPSSYPVWRVFHPIRFNDNISISIQASSGHYCEPRETLDDIKGYQSWEIMFDLPKYREKFYRNDEGELSPTDLIQIETLKLNPNASLSIDDGGDIEAIVINPDYAFGGILFEFPHQDVFSCYDSVAGRVSTEDIQDMVDFLRARFGLRNS